MKTLYQLGVLAGSVVLAAGSLEGAVVQATVGTYDAATNANAVDRNASTSAITSTNGNDVAGFTSAVGTAFAANTGGVVNFDTNTGNLIDGPINATYGTSGAKTLSIGFDSNTATDTFNLQTSTNIPAISGSSFLFSPDNTITTQTFTFGTITGTGVDPNERVTRAGLTLLGRNGGTANTPTVTATYSDNTTTPITGTAFSTTGANTQDTFYGFTAPANASITSIAITFGGASGDRRLGVDDLGFITSIVPEPTSLGLLALGSLGLLRRSRRDQRLA